jgi:hypothetical protein
MSGMFNWSWLAGRSHTDIDRHLWSVAVQTEATIVSPTQEAAYKAARHTAVGRVRTIFEALECRFVVTPVIFETAAVARICHEYEVLLATQSARIQALTARLGQHHTVNGSERRDL